MILSKLNERWSPDMLVLYDWYSLLMTEFVSEIIKPEFDSEKDTFYMKLSEDEIELFKEEEYKTIFMVLDERQTQCEICYMEYEGSHNFVVLPPCLHFFCK